jgi:hypothetical protein
MFERFEQTACGAAARSFASAIEDVAKEARKLDLEKELLR